MNLSQEEFESYLKESQNLLLEILAENKNVSIGKFYRVANFLEYLNSYSGVIYTVIQSAKDNEVKRKNNLSE